MLGKICYIKLDSKKEKYIIFGSYYNNEVLDIIGVNENNLGIIKQIRGTEVELDSVSQEIINKL